MSSKNCSLAFEDVAELERPFEPDIENLRETHKVIKHNFSADQIDHSVIQVTGKISISF